MHAGHFGPYEIEVVLGRGGMGTVWRAGLMESRYGLAPGTRVALKIVHTHLLETETFRSRFQREARLGQYVDHPNVVRTFGHETIDMGMDRHEVLVMEYVEGQTLRALMDEVPRVPEALARTIAVSLTRGLVAIHAAGVVHRDLKPDNALITADHQVKIMDLGVARLQDERIRLTREDRFTGTVEYAAPEQFRGRQDVLDGRSDLFSLGVMLYELATGVHPFRASDPRAVFRRILEEEPRKIGERNPQISPFFEEVVATLLAKQPEDRFPSAESLLEVLDTREGGAWWARRARSLRESHRRPLRRTAVPHDTDVVGRDAELEVLRDAYARARDGQGQVVLLRGEAGIGKTRLVGELVQRLRQSGEDPDLLAGAHPPGGLAPVAGALATAFRDHLGPENLESTLGDLLTRRWFLLPAFAALLAGDPLPEGTEPLTQRSMHTAFVSLTRALARQRPLVILIDDLHNAPEEGLTLLTALGRAIENERVLLIGSGRRQLSAAWVSDTCKMPHAQQLELERLGPQDLRDLLMSALRAPLLVRDLEPAIALKSGGNPYFVFEILRSLRDKGSIARRPDGSWTATGRAEIVDIPSSLHDLVQDRITRLGKTERELLDVAACCGFEFDPLLVAEVAELDRIPVLRTLGRIETDHRLVRSRGRRFVFDHHQVMEVLYASLSPLLREEYHALIAAALQRRLDPDRPAGTQGPLIVDICRHGLRGLHPESVVTHLEDALDHLRNGHQIAETIRLLDQALESPGLVGGSHRLQVLLRRNAALAMTGRREKQEETLQRARELAENLDRSDLQAEVELARAHLAFDQGHVAEAQRSFTSCLENARDLRDGGLELRARGGLGLVAYREARFEDALRYFAENQAQAEEIGRRSVATAALGNQGIVLQALGRNEEALDCVNRVLAVAQETGDLRLEGKCCDNLGILHQGLGRVEEARRFYTRAVDLADQVGDRMSQAVGRVNLGSFLREQDHLAEGVECLQSALAIGTEIGDPVNQATCLDNLGAVARVLGDHAGAREHLEAALALCRRVGSKRDEAYVLENLGDLAVDEGRLAEAQEALESSVALRREIGYPVGEASALATLGRVVAARGDPARAVELLEEAIELAGQHHAPSESLRARAARCRLPGGSVEDACAALEEHRDRAERDDVLGALLVVWQQTGDPALLREARRLLDERIARAPPDRRGAMRRRVPLHRAILEATRTAEPGGSP